MWPGETPAPAKRSWSGRGTWWRKGRILAAIDGGTGITGSSSFKDQKLMHTSERIILAAIDEKTNIAPCGILVIRKIMPVEIS